MAQRKKKEAKLVVCVEGQRRHAVEAGGEGGVVDARFLGARKARPLLHVLELGEGLEVEALHVALAFGLQRGGGGGGKGGREEDGEAA